MADPEITHSEILRDKIFEHLPTQARKTLIGVRVTYWPNNAGEMVLNLEYNALDNCLDIEAKEGIYGPGEKLTGHHVRSCELDAHTAGIHGYSEFMEATESSTRPIDEDIVEAERDAIKFDETKLKFFLSLFEGL